MHPFDVYYVWPWYLYVVQLIQRLLRGLGPFCVPTVFIQHGTAYSRQPAILTVLLSPASGFKGTVT